MNAVGIYSHCPELHLHSALCHFMSVAWGLQPLPHVALVGCGLGPCKYPGESGPGTGPF